MPSRTGKELLFEGNPQLRDEWDYEKNMNIDPERLTSGSGKSAWWKCSAGHEWMARIESRGKRGTGCVQCIRDTQIENNPLSLNEDLAAQLDDPEYVASSLSRGSTRKVWWKCEEGHRWQATVAARTGAKTGCPFCGGFKAIRGVTDLSTLRPDLVAQWDDDDLSPEDFTVSSTKRVRWRCERGHQWVTSIHTRTSSRTLGNGCPYCPGSRGRNAKVLVGSNDLATLYPQIASEIHSTDITAQEVRIYSSKKLEWKCSEGHIWTTTVADRVLGSGCIHCSTAQTSKIEGRLRTLISSKDYLSGTALDHNHRLAVPWRNRKRMAVDIYCEWRGLPVVIEYDGAFWHTKDDSIVRDLDKTHALLSNDYIVVRIRENGLPLLEIDHANLLQLNVQYSPHEDTNLEEAIEKMEIWLNSRV